MKLGWALAATLLATACSSSGSSGSHPHHAEAKLVVLVDGRGSGAQAKVLVPFVTSDKVLRGVIMDMNLHTTVAKLTREISAHAGDAGDLEIDVVDADATRAAGIANTDARELIRVVQAQSPNVNITIVQPAAAPSAPRS